MYVTLFTVWAVFGSNHSVYDRWLQEVVVRLWKHYYCIAGTNISAYRWCMKWFPCKRSGTSRILPTPNLGCASYQCVSRSVPQFSLRSYMCSSCHSGPTVGTGLSPGDQSSCPSKKGAYLYQNVADAIRNLARIRAFL
jgi:hypothetical protein